MPTATGTDDTKINPTSTVSLDESYMYIYYLQFQDKYGQKSEITILQVTTKTANVGSVANTQPPP